MSANRGGAAQSSSTTTTTTTTHETKQEQPRSVNNNNNNNIFYAHMFSGACAGTMEHTLMFPVDTIKTRMQLATHLSGHHRDQSYLQQQQQQQGISLQKSTQTHAAQSKSSFKNVIKSIVRTDGVKGLYRGVVAGGLGAGPAHAIYFASYEYFKTFFRRRSFVNDDYSFMAQTQTRTSNNNNSNNNNNNNNNNEKRKMSEFSEIAADATAGALATTLGDAVQTPLDTVKQRMQMQLGGQCPSEVKYQAGEGAPFPNTNSTNNNNKRVIGGASSSQKSYMQQARFKNAFEAMRTIVKNEGVSVLYRSYPTTLIMNVPFTAIHVGLYESTKRALKIEEEDEGFRTQFLAGGFAGGIASFLTTPMDVVKTRMQTHCEVVLKCDVAKTVEHSTLNQSCAIRGDPVRCLQTGALLLSPTTIQHQQQQQQNIKSIYASTNAFKVAAHVARTEGVKALFSGAHARVLFHVPAAAICWSTYELMKRTLGIEMPADAR